MRESITFLRLRPAEDINELWAATRRREGTTAVEVEALDENQRAAALAGGLTPISVGPGASEPLAWVADPAAAVRLAKDGVAGWRVTVVDSGDRAAVLDAVARSRAAFLRTRRSRVARAAELVALPAIVSRVSVFVDSVDEAVKAVGSGARDLLLRGWTTETLGELRSGLPAFELIERGALPIEVTVDDARSSLPSDLFTAYLHQIDASGSIRPRYEWAPGMDTPAPIPHGRVSAQWSDQSWLETDYALDLDALEADIAGILERSLNGPGTNPRRD